MAICGRFEPSSADLRGFAEAVGFNGQTGAAMRWLVVARQLRAIVDELLTRTSSQGAPGLERVDWGAQVQPGDQLTVRRETLETRVSSKRPGIGLTRFRFDTLNQHDEVVLSVSQWMMFRRDDAAEAPMPSATSASAASASAASARRAAVHYLPPGGEQRMARMPDPWSAWHRVSPGAIAQLGSCRFDGEDIIAFARAFDPQPFHIDAEAARASLFGRLCASGLQTAVAWAALAEDSRWVVQPKGLRHLRWHRPVFAGETIAYRSVARDVNLDAARPGLAWITRSNQGLDAEGQVVIELEDVVAATIAG